MLKKLVAALGVTTICSNVSPVYSLPNNDQEKDHARSIAAKRITVKRAAWLERIQERRRLQAARKKARSESLLERRKMRQMGFILRKQRVVETRMNRHIMRITKTVNRAMKLGHALNAEGLKNISRTRKKATEFAYLLDRPNVKEVLRPSMYPEIIKVREPIEVYQHIESVVPFVGIQNLQTQKVVVNQSYPTLNVAPEDFEEVTRHRPASQGPTILEETPQETFGMTPILETVDAAIQYVKDIFTPTPTPMHEETPFEGEGSTPLPQHLTPLETETPFTEGEKTPLIQNLILQITPSKVDNLDGFTSFDDAENPERKLEANVQKILFGSSSSNAVRVQGRLMDSGSSSEDIGSKRERKSKVPTIPLGSSPNSVRVMGEVKEPPIRSGSSSSGDSPSRFRVKKIPLQLGLEAVIEEPENELTLTTLQTKLKRLVGLEVLHLPENSQSKHAADSFCKLRASIEGAEKTAVPGEIVKELPLLLTSIEKYLPRMEQDQVPSPRRALIENANVKYVDNWLNELFRLNGLESDQ